MTIFLRFARLSPRPSFGLRALLDWSRQAESRFRQRLRLAELDDRMLRDVGVTRPQVDTSQPWWKLQR